MDMVGQPFGLWCPSIPDKRDLIYKGNVDRPYPKHVDWRNTYVPRMSAQGQLNSGTVCVVQYLLQYHEYARTLGAIVPPKYSTLFHYYYARLLEGSVTIDNGVCMRNVFKAMKKYGLCEEEYWPYRISYFTAKPAIVARQMAAKKGFQGHYKRVVQTRDAMLSCLQKHPFVIGLAVYNSFLTDVVRLTGIVGLPDLENETLQGGVALCVIGYDQLKHIYYALTSFGPGWGEQGCIQLPYAYVEDVALAADVWTVEVDV